MPHLNWKPPDPNLLICCICGFQRDNKYGVLKHIKRHLFDPLCDPRRSEIDQQIIALNNAKFKNFRCERCNQYFSSLFNLNAHLKRSCRSLNSNQIEKLTRKIIDLVDDPKDLQKAILLLTKKLEELCPDLKEEQQKIRFELKLEDDFDTIITDIANETMLNYVGHETLEMLEDPHIAVSLIEKAANPVDYKVLRDTLVEIFELVHCHFDYPENWNIYAGYGKNTYPIHAYDRDEWHEYDVKYLLHDICCKQCLCILKNLAKQLLKNDLISEETLSRLKASLLFLKDKHRRITFFRFTGNLFFEKLYENKKMIKKVYLKKREQKTT